MTGDQVNCQRSLPQSETSKCQPHIQAVTQARPLAALKPMCPSQMTFPGHTASTCFPSCCLRSLPRVIPKVCVTLEDCKRQEAPLLASSDGGLTTLLLEVLHQRVVYSKFPNQPTSTLFSRPWTQPRLLPYSVESCLPSPDPSSLSFSLPWAPFPHATQLPDQATC